MVTFSLQFFIWLGSVKWRSTAEIGLIGGIWLFREDLCPPGFLMKPQRLQTFCVSHETIQEASASHPKLFPASKSADGFFPQTVWWWKEIFPNSLRASENLRENLSSPSPSLKANSRVCPCLWTQQGSTPTGWISGATLLPGFKPDHMWNGNCLLILYFILFLNRII